MATFRNKNFTKRDYECTNVAACIADEAPNENWEEVATGWYGLLHDMTRLHTTIQNGKEVTYYGYL